MDHTRARWAYGPGIVVFLGLAIALSGGTSSQGKRKAVVELFTSQGCSSCPPADKLLGKLAKRDDIIALSLPVDYWDYLGWKDTLASPTFSARQRSYARARGDGQVYTPQMIIGGTRHEIGSHPDSVKRAIAQALSDDHMSHVPLKVWTEGDTLIISAGSARGTGNVKPATVWLALVQNAATVTIERGENRGTTNTYYRVVRELTPVGQWAGEAVTIRLPKQHLKSRGADGCTVLLQEDSAGPILAAAEMKAW